MFFSVIIPTFNREDTILRALKSVKLQSFKDFEIIIIDDASTDKTYELLSSFKDLKLITNTKNQGVSFSRNLGAKNATGEYLAFLDSDDEWLPSKLELQFELIQKTKAKLVHTEEIWIRNGKRVNQPKTHKKGGGDQFKSSCERCVVAPSSVVMKKNIFMELGLFREDFLVCEDYDLWLKYTSLYETYFIETPLMIKYGGRPDQLSTKYFAMDYYRVKSLDWILKHRNLNPNKYEIARSILLKKSEILIKGYKKHQNTNELLEISSLYSFWLGNH